MPDITYELKVEAEEQEPLRLQVISYDNEGENLPGVPVHLELVNGDGSIGPDGSDADNGTHLDVVTNNVAKAYFMWKRPAGQTGEATSVIRASWQGVMPFVFIERYHRRDEMELV